MSATHSTDDTREARREAFRLRKWGRRYQPRRACQKCASAPLGPFALVVSKGDSVHFTGVETCGSWHSCPVCSRKLAAIRVGNLSAVARHWTQGSPIRTMGMLTLTLRHGPQHRLERLLDVLVAAWRRLSTGRRRAELAALVGDVAVRGLEVRHSAAGGWHPHLHVMTMTTHHSPERRKEIDERLREMWFASALAVLSPEEAEELAPSLERGARYTEGAAAQYIGKLGFELGSGQVGKVGKRGSRSPWDILRACGTDEHSERLWREYSKAMHGRRQLTWRRGLIDESKSDLELLAEADRGTIEMAVPRALYRRLQHSGGDIRWLDWMRRDPPAAARWLESKGGKILRDSADLEPWNAALRAPSARRRHPVWSSPRPPPDAPLSEWRARLVDLSALRRAAGVTLGEMYRPELLAIISPKAGDRLIVAARLASQTAA